MSARYTDYTVGKGHTKITHYSIFKNFFVNFNPNTENDALFDRDRALQDSKREVLRFNDISEIKERGIIEVHSDREEVIFEPCPKEHLEKDTIWEMMRGNALFETYNETAIGKSLDVEYNRKRMRIVFHYVDGSESVLQFVEKGGVNGVW